MNRVEKRAIEALAIAPVIRAVTQKIGMESALAILREVSRQEAFQRGLSLRKSDGQSGIDEFSVEFSCLRDEPFARGFNPRLILIRTKTLMESADHCDFQNYLNAK